MEHTFPPVAPGNISETVHETRREVSKLGEFPPRETEGEAGSTAAGNSQESGWPGDSEAKRSERVLEPVVEPTNGMDVGIDRSERLRGIQYFPTGSSSGRIVG